MNPPKHAAVFCVDEKTVIQALDRSQPALPLRPGRPQPHAVDYVRHGTVSLFAALEVRSGKIQGRCAPRHTSQESVRFLDEAVGNHQRQAIHVLLDNLAVHKTPRVRAWLQHHPQLQLHFTPPYASWRKQLEIWLGMVTRDCLRRGIFRSVPDLVHKIMTSIRLDNRHAQPFRWTYRNPRKRIHVSLSSVT